MYKFQVCCINHYTMKSWLPLRQLGDAYGTRTRIVRLRVLHPWPVRRKHQMWWHLWVSNPIFRGWKPRVLTFRRRCHMIWWEGWDSNSRNLSITDLQSACFDRLHTFPCGVDDGTRTRIESYWFQGPQPCVLPIRLRLPGDTYGIWTRDTAVKGRCLNHLTIAPYTRKYYFLVFELNILPFFIGYGIYLWFCTW